MRIHPAIDENELLLRLRNGDELAFKHIFDRYYRRLCVYAGRFVIHSEEAEDIVGEVFMRLWNGNRDFQRLEHVKASLYLSVKNIGINQHHSMTKSMERNYRFSQERGEADDFYLLEITRTEALHELYKAISLLPDKAGQIILKTYIDGKSNQEVADEMGISVQTVKNQKHRALSLLRNRLSPGSFEMLVACCLIPTSYQI